LLEQSFTAYMPLLTATSTFELGRRLRISSTMLLILCPYHKLRERRTTD